MTRVRANLLLVFTAAIWGTAFVAQSTAMEALGPLAFVGVRFLLAALVVWPLAVWEARRRGRGRTRGQGALVATVAAVFLAGNVLQQEGILYTSVTNAGFLTTLYVVMVPFAAWAIFRVAPPAIVWPAALLSLGGTFLLGGGRLDALGAGDALVIGSAVFWAIHVAIAGFAVQRTNRPMLLAATQFAFTGVVALAAALVLEQPTVAAVVAAAPELAYAGILSGGLGFTLQFVAQRSTPPADAAVILSAEALFAAMAGAILLGERLPAVGWAGAGAILAAILLVQLVPLLRTRRAAACP